MSNRLLYIILSLTLSLAVHTLSAQDRMPVKANPHRSARSQVVSVKGPAKEDSVMRVQVDSVPVMTKADSMSLVKMQKKIAKQKRDWTKWTPDPKRAMWLAIVLPGAGQIYNRKYWKLPIIYGGILGCAYAMRWNNQMYHDYSQAYNDLVDNDPNTDSYNQFMHLGAKITSENASRYQTIFKNRKDTYRRWRDLSFFCMLGVYAISIIDAYVDASLSKFDISDDISLRVQPAVINGHVKGVNRVNSSSEGILNDNAIGVHGSLTF